MVLPWTYSYYGYHGIYSVNALSFCLCYTTAWTTFSLGNNHPFDHDTLVYVCYFLCMQECRPAYLVWHRSEAIWNTKNLEVWVHYSRWELSASQVSDISTTVYQFYCISLIWLYYFSIRISEWAAILQSWFPHQRHFPFYNRQSLSPFESECVFFKAVFEIIFIVTM